MTILLHVEESDLICKGSSWLKSLGNWNFRYMKATLMARILCYDKPHWLLKSLCNNKIHYNSQPCDQFSSCYQGSLKEPARHHRTKWENPRKPSSQKASGDLQSTNHLELIPLKSHLNAGPGPCLTEAVGTQCHTWLGWPPVISKLPRCPRLLSGGPWAGAGPGQDEFCSSLADAVGLPPRLWGPWPAVSLGSWLASLVAQPCLCSSW